jgi:hypothetical protein
MTLGSPIDTYLLLWPELFGTTPPHAAPPQPIVWHNYYDEGDPIGFALDDARRWIAEQRWDNVFDFPARHDHGFARYPFPGKAHIDYWTDPDVFGRFISAVIEERPDDLPTPVDALPPPTNRRVQKVLSYVVPCLGVTTLLFVAVYILLKAVMGILQPEWKGTGEIFWDVARITLVLCGVTVAARIPRLAGDLHVRLSALVCAAVACGVYYWTAPDEPTRVFSMYWPSGVATVTLASIMVLLAYGFGRAGRPAVRCH